MKLIKKQLLALPPTPLPKGLRLPKNQSPDYIYTARAHGGILAIELYRPGGRDRKSTRLNSSHR